MSNQLIEQFGLDAPEPVTTYTFAVAAGHEESQRRQPLGGPSHQNDAYPWREQRPTSLREAIVGRWKEGSRRPARTLIFEEDGSFRRFDVGTEYYGSYKVIDETTLEVKSDRVLSVQPNFVTERMNVTLQNGVLRIRDFGLYGFVRDENYPTKEPPLWRTEADWETELEEQMRKKLEKLRNRYSP